MSIVAEEDAKTQFESLMERASHGEVIVITREGRPVIEIKPAEETPESSGAHRDETDANHAARLDAAVAEIDRLAQKYADRRITLDEIREWINEGRP